MVLPNDFRDIAKIHFDELQRFMGQRLEKEPFNSRFIARERLTRLTTLQFYELTVDVYDEVIRRKTNTVGNEIPFLPVRDDFHLKRNQARQKLSILSKSSFRDLVGDVLFELGRRYPEFREPEVRARPHARRPSSVPPVFSLHSHSQRPAFQLNSTQSDAPNFTASHDDTRKLAKIHFDELQRFRGHRLAKEPPNSRSVAREKLTCLTALQFQELTVDVYDELVRRNNNTVGNEVLFLPIQDDFHPKRNRARQKLATLPRSRFKDLAGDVLFELRRRYPEFHESEVPNRPGFAPKHIPRS